MFNFKFLFWFLWFHLWMKTKVRIIKGLSKVCQYAKKKLPLCTSGRKRENFLARGWWLARETSSGQSRTQAQTICKWWLLVVTTPWDPKAQGPGPLYPLLFACPCAGCTAQSQRQFQNSLDCKMACKHIFLFNARYECHPLLNAENFFLLLMGAVGITKHQWPPI